jgi:hypothetical protein
MDVSQFAADLRGRIKAAQEAYDEAEREEDFYAMDVRSGELKSLRRLASENGVDLSDSDPDHTQSANRENGVSAADSAPANPDGPTAGADE